MPKVTTQRGQGQAQTTSPRAKTSGFQSAWDFTDKYKVCLYGASGEGKTTFWCDWPKPILCLVASGSKKPGELKSVPPEYRSQIEAPVVPDLQRVHDLLENLDDYETVVLDHGSGLLDLAIRDVIGVTDLPAQKTFGMATQQQWGQAIAQTKEVMAKLFNARGHTIIVCQERIFEPESESSDIIRARVGAGVSPSLAAWLHPTADYIVQAVKIPKTREKVTKIQTPKGTKEKKSIITVEGEFDYALRTGVSDTYTTKFRRPKSSKPLPKFIINPTFEKFDALARGE
jgi:hypothetical protein